MDHKRGFIIACGIILVGVLISIFAGNGKGRATNKTEWDFTNKEETVIYVDIAWGEIVDIEYGGDFYGGNLFILFEDGHLIIIHRRTNPDLLKIERVHS